MSATSQKDISKQKGPEIEQENGAVFDPLTNVKQEPEEEIIDYVNFEEFEVVHGDDVLIPNSDSLLLIESYEDIPETSQITKKQYKKSCQQQIEKKRNFAEEYRKRKEKRLESLTAKLDMQPTKCPICKKTYKIFKHLKEHCSTVHNYNFTLVSQRTIKKRQEPDDPEEAEKLRKARERSRLYSKRHREKQLADPEKAEIFKRKQSQKTKTCRLRKELAKHEKTDKAERKARRASEKQLRESIKAKISKEKEKIRSGEYQDEEKVEKQNEMAELMTLLNKRPSKCPICEKKFDILKKLKEHCKKVHNYEYSLLPTKTNKKKEEPDDPEEAEKLRKIRERNRLHSQRYRERQLEDSEQAKIFKRKKAQSSKACQLRKKLENYESIDAGMD